MTEERLPGNDRVTQPTVLVAGGARELVRQIPLQLLAARAEPGDAAVIVTAREDPAVVARRLCGAVEALVPARVATVDATTTGPSALSRVDELHWQVPSPTSFRQLRTAVDVALTELRARDAERVHFVVDTLTTQFRLGDGDDVHRHAHHLAMTAGAEAGVGQFALEPAATTDREYERLRHLMDVEVCVRRTASGPKVRWQGLVGTSDGWVPLVDSGPTFDALGRNIG